MPLVSILESLWYIALQGLQIAESDNDKQI